MILCVGAASRRVIEEAAKLHVHQVVASRRQVGEFKPGYTGFTSASLVETVKSLSGGATRVVRDHGGPYQNGDPDDNWVSALDADVDAGFDGLHLDVCQLARDEQPDTLTGLCERYSGLALEVGGERDTQFWLYRMLDYATRACQPYAAVAALGGRIWADRQCGGLVSLEEAERVSVAYTGYKVAVKAHNLDWLGKRAAYGPDFLYNVAPEFGNVEVDAWLHVLPWDEAQHILSYAYATDAWGRWFRADEGTYLERSRAALRYHLESPTVRKITDKYDDTYVRMAVRDAIIHG